MQSKRGEKELEPSWWYLQHKINRTFISYIWELSSATFKKSKTKAPYISWVWIAFIPNPLWWHVSDSSNKCSTLCHQKHFQLLKKKLEKLWKGIKARDSITLTIAIEFSRPELMPKSVIFGSPLRFTSRFAGLMSLWTRCLTPCK